MIPTHRMAVALLSVVTLTACVRQAAVAPSGPDVDLGIADDETYKRPVSWSMMPDDSTKVVRVLRGDSTGPASRPGLSIAWRNASQIEEVEVKVRNLGKDPGEGRVFVDILDESGKPILHLDPPDDQKLLRLPAVDRGGQEGKIIRMKASHDLNTLIDRLDRARIRYGVKATVETIGPDRNPFDNSKVKSWNIPFAVRPGFLNVYNYIFRNHGDISARVKWMFEHTPYPAGWEIRGIPDDANPFVIAPGQEIRGQLTMLAPMQIEEGAFVESRLSLVNVADGTLFQQHEWFQVYDTQPPDISNYQIVKTNDGRLAIQLLVADKGSGVLEATGVTTEYSTDGGRTWSTRAHNYTRGNFVTPTVFEAVLGPFAPGTTVQLRISARDTAGNVQAVIPRDARLIEAPADTEHLLQQSLAIFPRRAPRELFELDPAKVTTTTPKVVQSPAEKLLNMTTIEVTTK